MSLTATRTNNPVNTNFLRDVGTGFAANTRGYATLQQLIGNGYIEFGFDQNTAPDAILAAGISYAIYPHAVRNSMSAFNLISYGFCVRGNENSNRIFVKAVNTYIDTTVDQSSSVRLRIEKAGNTINFFTVIGGVQTLRHSVTLSALPLVSEFIILAGKNGCRLTNVIIFGATQQPGVLDPTKNIYIPLEGELRLRNNEQSVLAVTVTNAQPVTWHFPDGTTSTDYTPDKFIPDVPYTSLIRLEIPSGVANISSLILPILRIDGRYTPPDLSLVTGLKSIRFITRFPLLENPPNPADRFQRRFVAITSQLNIPSGCEQILFELLQFQFDAGGRFDAAPIMLPEAFNFAGRTALRVLRLGHTQDLGKYQPGFQATAKFPNLVGCANLTSFRYDTYHENSGVNTHFADPVPFSFLRDCVNLTSFILRETRFVGFYNEAFVTSVLVALARVVGNRTTPALTLEISRAGTPNPVTGNILSLAAAAANGATSISVNSTTGLGVGDRIMLQEGTTATSSVTNPLTIASITGTSAPFTITFQSGQSLQNAYTTAGRVFNLETSLGSAQRLRLLGHTLIVGNSSSSAPG